MNVVSYKEISLKEIPIEERYDRLLDAMALSTMISYALAQEVGAVDKLNDLNVLAMKKMMPSYLSLGLKVMRMLAPGKTFEKVLENFGAYGQTYHSVSDIDATQVSDREVVVNINCKMFKRMRDTVQKIGLDIDPRIWCKAESYIYPNFMSEFGLDVTHEVTANGCQFTLKPK